jgi:hypothetical protein
MTIPIILKDKKVRYPLQVLPFLPPHPLLSLNSIPLLFMMVKSTFLLGALAAVGSYVQGKEIKVDDKKAARLYDSGKVHNQLMQSKMVCSPATAL